MQSYSWPSEKEISYMRKKLSRGLASRLLPEGAGPVDKLKYDLCIEFVKYSNANDLTQKKLSKKLGIDPSLVNKIVHCIYDEFTVDRLVRYLMIIYPNLNLKLKVA